MAPNHSVWKRVRYDHHSGAKRSITISTPVFGRRIPVKCEDCETLRDNSDQSCDEGIGDTWVEEHHQQVTISYSEVEIQTDILDDIDASSGVQTDMFRYVKFVCVYIFIST